jgi:uncharacterized lipoprotein YbaY
VKDGQEEGANIPLPFLVNQNPKGVYRMATNKELQAQIEQKNQLRLKLQNEGATLEKKQAELQKTLDNTNQQKTVLQETKNQLQQQLR